MILDALTLRGTHLKCQVGSHLHVVVKKRCDIILTIDVLGSPYLTTPVNGLGMNMAM
jgi:hypothetical protein